MPNTKPTIAEILLSMPNVGEDADFARVEYRSDKMTASAEAAIDDALAEVDASSQQIESMDRKAVEKQRKKPVSKLKGFLHRPGQPPVPVEEMSILAPRNIRKRYTSAELMAECDRNAEMTEEMKAWDQMVPVGREIIK